MAYLSILVEFVGDFSFQVSFWSNLLAGLVIALAVSWALPRIIEVRKRPDLVFEFVQEHPTFLELKKGEPKTLKLGVSNRNRNIYLSTVYWHLFVPLALEPKLIPRGGRVATSEIHGEWKEFSGGTGAEEPLFPERGLNFPHGLLVQPRSTGDSHILFFFSTEYGISPRSARTAVKNLDQAIAKGHLGSLTLRVREG